MEIDLGTSIKLTKEQTEELYAIREPTTIQLMQMAEKCGLRATCDVNLGQVFLTDMDDMLYEPQNILSQNYILLSTVIAKGDCKVFYDDGVHEYFIYRYIPGPETHPPIAHQYTLQDATFEAAMNLWFPED